MAAADEISLRSNSRSRGGIPPFPHDGRAGEDVPLVEDAAGYGHGHGDHGDDTDGSGSVSGHTASPGAIPSAEPTAERSSSSSSSNKARATRKLTRLDGLALVISLQIGSGIFTVPSQVAQFVATPGWAIVCWFLAGLLVWTGAASFIELGLRVPRNGGIQEYLRACYGDHAGFLFTWTWVVLAKPASQAAIATIAANYLCRAVTGADGESEWVVRAVALLCVAAVTLVNCLGATAGVKAANVFLFLKLAAVASIVVLGLAGWLLADGEGVPASPDGWFGLAPEMGQTSPWRWMADFVTATFGALFCYGGWETVRSAASLTCARAMQSWACGTDNTSTDRLCGRRHGEPPGRPACRDQRGNGDGHHRLLPDERRPACLPALRRDPGEQDGRSGKTQDPLGLCAGQCPCVRQRERG